MNDDSVAARKRRTVILTLMAVTSCILELMDQRDLALFIMLIAVPVIQVRTPIYPVIKQKKLLNWLSGVSAVVALVIYGYSQGWGAANHVDRSHCWPVLHWPALWCMQAILFYWVALYVFLAEQKSGKSGSPDLPLTGSVED